MSEFIFELILSMLPIRVLLTVFAVMVVGFLLYKVL